ncbi:hypothetical protein CLH39_18270 [Alcaligenes faecalis]|uniref:hypothetical protein n=1 Tax=Alcaligenes faecalis TaxID=511 RepID=UPI000756F994|nr:hypothetical protein [Alcaligenes faecalis]KVX06920.1 hypothetical protein ASL22_11210 [Alcaligenes faecalis]QRF92030.1 hypothetical protein CLH39_18270 [Alcaligenes faecalis]
MNIKHKTAAEYSNDHTDACEIALVALLRAFGSLKNDLRLVGGLVPRYLTPSKPPEVPEHTGTTDVDIVLNITVLAATGTYDKLKRQLKDGGFVRYQPGPNAPVSSWQWVYNADDTPIVVEFLQHTDDPAQSSFLVQIDGEDVSACQILYAGIAHDWFEEKEIVVELPNNGGIVRETIRYADVVAFIVLKALAFKTRHERKDASDLIHVMRYWGSIESLAELFSERLGTGTHGGAIELALAALKENFCEEPEIPGYRKDGPSAVANFHGLQDVDEETRIREQRDVSGMVEHFVHQFMRLRGNSADK